MLKSLLFNLITIAYQYFESKCTIIKNKNNVKPHIINIIQFDNGFTIFRGQGGVEAEREERERWIDHERRKIQESVKGKELLILYYAKL